MKSMHYVGLDVHKKTIAYCVKDGQGRRLEQGEVAANRVALVIPCHRVLRGSGELGGYRWGPERKRAMLAWEAVRTSSRPEAPGRHSVST